MAGNYSDTTNIVDTQQIDAADVKTPIDALDDAIYDALHGETPQFNQLRFEADTTVTIDSVSEAITISQTYHKVANFGGAGTDDLVDILGYNEGDVLVLQPINAANITIVKHNGGGSGNIRLQNGQDFYLTGQRMLVLMNDGTLWYQIGGTYGNQLPRFHASKTSTQGLSAGVPAKIVWHTKPEDVGSMFVLASDRYLPTIAGNFIFNAGYRVTGLAATDTLIIFFYKNGSPVASKKIHAGASADLGPGLVWREYMNGSTDFMEVYAQTSNASTIQFNSTQTWFKGYLDHGVKES